MLPKISFGLCGVPSKAKRHCLNLRMEVVLRLTQIRLPVYRTYLGKGYVFVQPSAESHRLASQHDAFLQYPGESTSQGAGEKATR